MSRPLTARTTPELLRREAKRWLHAVRAGDASAIARLLAMYPKAPAAPALRDVQQALAREYGFVDWRALTRAVTDGHVVQHAEQQARDIILRHGWDGSTSAALQELRAHPALGASSLCLAAATGNLGAVRRWIAEQPSTVHQVEGPPAFTPLMHVAFARIDPGLAVEISELLLEAGSDPQVQVTDGWGNVFTPITGAIGGGERAHPVHPHADRLVGLLVAHGAHPFDRQALYNDALRADDCTWLERLFRWSDERGARARWYDENESPIAGRVPLPALDTLLGMAVERQQIGRVRWLLEHGANANTPHPYSGRTVHTLARLAGHDAMVRELERFGAREAQLSPVEQFMTHVMLGRSDAARALAGSEPSLMENRGLLHAAASHDNVSAVSTLLALGADVQGFDDDGATALHRAAQVGAVQVVHVLLEAGAAVDLRDHRWRGTPLSWARVFGQSSVAELLVPLSEDVRALAALGALPRLQAVLERAPSLADRRLEGVDAPTPLFCLPENDDMAQHVARLLLAYGADPSVVDVRGRTPAAVARERGLSAAAALLERA